MSDKVYLGGVYTNKTETWQERDEHDFYPTERNAIEAVLDKTDLTPYLSQNPWVLDAGAADGRWGLAVKRRYPYVKLVGTDIRDLPKPEGFDHWITGELGNIYALHTILWVIQKEEELYTSKSTFTSFSVSIGNPAYKIADDWIRLTYQVMDKNNSIMSYLLASNWGSGEGRYREFYNNDMPLSRLLFYNTRPAFQQKKQPAEIKRKGVKVTNPKAGELVFDKDGEPIMSTYPGRDYAQFEWRFSYGRAVNSLEATLRYRFNPIDHIVYERK